MASSRDTIQNLTIIFDSVTPFISKWWCMGAILKMRLPLSLKEATWVMTERASTTKTPPKRTKRSSFFVMILTIPIKTTEDLSFPHRP